MSQPVEQPSHLPRASGKFVSHVFALITGNGLAQVVAGVGTLILARLFAPDAFGSFALFMTIVSFLSVLGGARYELAVMLPERDEEAANVLLLSILALSGISAFSLLLVMLFRASIARLLGDAHLNLWLWGAPVAVFVNGLYQVLGVWFGRMKRFKQLAIARVCQALGTVLGQLGLLLVTTGGFALVGGWVFGQAFGSLILVIQLFRGDARFISRARDWSVVRQSVGKYRNFPIYKAPYSFIANATSQMVFVILRIFSSLNVVGLYSMAARAVYLPVNLIASSMNDVFYEKAATELRHGRLEKFVTRLLRIQIVLAAPILVLTSFDAKLVFGFLFGPKWIPAATYAAILSWASFLYFLTSWLDRLFDVRGRQRLSLGLEFSGNTLSLAGMALALWLHPESTVPAVGIYAGCQVVYSAIWLIFAYRIAEFHVRELVLLLRDAVLSLAIAAILMGSVHVLFGRWVAFGLSSIVAAVMVGFAFVRYVSTGLAFMSPAERFRQFWADKDSTLNGREGEDFWRAQAGELRNLFPEEPPQRVLEIGCGDGSLFPYFGISPANYTGVDFTPQFIERFKTRQPAVRLECAEGASYLDHETQYDLILLNGIVQHFDRAMLEQHLQNATAMMKGGSRLIWGSIPQRRHRTLYDAGKWSGGGKASVARWCKSWVGRILGLDAMGYWYEPEEVASLAKKYGLQVRFVPSALYPYRFHATITKVMAHRSEQEPVGRAFSLSV